MANFARRSNSAQVVRVCKMFYERDLLQSEIAVLENLSPSTVSRIIAEAKADGVVSLRIAVPRHEMVANEILEKFSAQGIKEVIIGGDTPNDIGFLAADFFDSELHRRVAATPLRGTSCPVGVVLDGGKTVQQFVAAVSGNILVDLTIFPICTDPPSYQVSSYELMTRLSTKFRSECQKLPFCLKKTTKLEKIHATVREEASKASFVFLGVGPLLQTFTALDFVEHLGEEPEFVRSRFPDVAAMVGYCPITSIGKLVEVDVLLNNMRRSLEFEDLRRMARNYPIQRCVLLSGDPRKLDAVNAAILSGVCNCLILDEHTGVGLLGQ